MEKEQTNIIESFLKTDFEKKLFRASQDNLNFNGNPLRFNNFAYSMRELIRHFLKRLAPDESVLSCSWYKNETGRDNGISRRQRVKFAIQGGLNDDYLKNKLEIELDDLQTSIKKSINNLNKFTHIEEQTFDINDDLIGKYVDFTFSSIIDFFNLILECKEQILTSMEREISSEVVDHTLSETILDIDILSTHQYIEEISTEFVKIRNIDHKFIHILAEGTIVVELQWGSGSDFRNDFGATMSTSFPFNCNLKSFVKNPVKFDTDQTEFNVDTDSFYE